MKIQISLSTKVEGYTGANGLYAWTEPDQASISRIKSAIAPLIIAKNDLHCTLIYSKTQDASGKEVVESSVDPKFRRSAGITEIVFWEGHDKTGYLVAKLKSEALHTRHSMYRDLGFEPTFPDYEPHMTLVNPCKMDAELQAFIDTKNKELSAKPLQIVLEGEHISDLKDD
jgi:hypothetical protein